MTNTTKYLLIGGAALVGVVIIGNRVIAENAGDSKPTGIAGALANATNLIKQVGGATGFSYATRPALPTDATATPNPKSDAMGYRQLNAFIPRQQTMTARERALVGLR